MVTRPVFRQGEARRLLRLRLHHRCTGLWLLPVVVERVQVMGQVLNVAEVPCIPPRPISP